MKTVIVYLVLICALVAHGQGLSLRGTLVAATQPQPLTPIQHIVIIIQENHAFDNMFGTFPGLLSQFALNMSACQPYSLTDPSQGCVKPFNADSVASVQQNDLGHFWRTSHHAYNRGMMNGFVASQVGTKYSGPPSYAMAYYTNMTLPNYWDYAKYYSLDANFFSSILSYSYPNHLYEVSAQAFSGCTATCVPRYDLTMPTIAEELNASGIDWRYYAGGWSDSNDCTNVSKLPGYESFWNVLPDFPRIQLSQSTCHKILNSEDFFRDISNGYLPKVAWITPHFYDSDHASFSNLTAGQIRVANIINAISSNQSLWGSTAIFLFWDDYGGYYDHVRPVQVDPYGYGFRVPLVVISPYVKHGIFYGPNFQQEDLTALLSTIEANWGLSPMSGRDIRAPPLWYMFDFSQSPTPPLILPSSSLAVYDPNTCLARGLCRVGLGSLAGAYQINSAMFHLRESTQPFLSPTSDPEDDPYD